MLTSALRTAFNFHQKVSDVKRLCHIREGDLWFPARTNHSIQGPISLQKFSINCLLNCSHYIDRIRFEMNNEQGQLDAVKDTLHRVAERLDEMSQTSTSHAAVQGNNVIWRLHQPSICFLFCVHTTYLIGPQVKSLCFQKQWYQVHF